jgi:hypothetical protein
MEIQKTILAQLGGNKFIAMTGSKNFLKESENTLRMDLTRNMSGANKLYITLDADDTYTMRFVKLVLPKLNMKTFEWSEQKVKEIEKFEGVYFDMLRPLFTQVTGMYTSLAG